MKELRLHALVHAAYPLVSIHRRLIVEANYRRGDQSAEACSWWSVRNRPYENTLQTTDPSVPERGSRWFSRNDSIIAPRRAKRKDRN